MNHKTLHAHHLDLHKQHNERVAKFHRFHAAQITKGRNGSGFFAKLERYFYKKVIIRFVR
ncbi:hypothetical protein [Sporolactobacillus pectinivorans]|uniref:hypothetical protein n=1 Tax=Sporolactobacillus pectinivorans TaxID=1591408 RepID=UPI000C2675A3|nr:hypothetical protein [Sporolactobacillus pectinivorans]